MLRAHTGTAVRAAEQPLLEAGQGGLQAGERGRGVRTGAAEPAFEERVQVHDFLERGPRQGVLDSGHGEPSRTSAEEALGPAITGG